MLQIIGKGGMAREVNEYASLQDSQMYENLELENMKPWVDTVIAIGDPHIREKIYKERPQYEYTTLNVGQNQRIPLGAGTIVCPGTIITTDVKIGNHVIININCSISHDVAIGDFTTISPGCIITGGVKIGKRCFIGAGSVFRDHISICDDVVVGAGAVVVKDITEPGTYVGNPAKLLKYEKEKDGN